MNYLIPCHFDLSPSIRRTSYVQDMCAAYMELRTRIFILINHQMSYYKKLEIDKEKHYDDSNELTLKINIKDDTRSFFFVIIVFSFSSKDTRVLSTLNYR